MATKKLYKIWQEVNDNYDAYDSAIVCAENENDVRNTKIGFEYDGEEDYFNKWAKLEFVKVKEIGIANDDIEKGIVLASFNAG